MSDSHAAPPEVLFTGFPGFLGSALLRRVLDRGDGPVACLIQPQYRELAEERAREIVSAVGGKWKGDAAAAAPAVDDAPATDPAAHLYEGDITEPDLGLGSALDDPDLLAGVEEVYHLAAVYDLSVDADLAAAVNVRGTEHVLDACERLGVDRLHYVSTCYVSGRYDGVFTADHLREGQSFNNHYEASKHRAEVAVRERMADGLPATIYRPAIAVGDSETGETDKLDGPYNLLRLLLVQPGRLAVAFSVPGADETELNVVPRDYVVDAIAELSGRPETMGETYQLCDPEPLTVPAFVAALSDAAGRRTVTVPTPKRLAKAAARLLSAAGVAVEPATIDYFDHPTRYRCPNAREALSGTGVSVPPFESYVDRLVAYARANPSVGDDPMT
ncbi:SDR family oxidoreductase [Halorubrum lipolyticum]|uniref:Male sterility domain-containing protein n=1 Tax=Halorubrum lipolyticum DSM 21995 TaxID=1227482 RepID=M0NPH2_9EURY|nr:SDR family oxidoreductase [Halorubrum lipolyticum]EMA59069.1 Male sterility domain-containing protein [Halorubrum lipolyticum DSM 21995]